jgi:O-antigen ligase
LYLLKGFNGAYAATAVGFLIAGIASLLFLYKTKNYSRHISTYIVIVVALGLFSMSVSESLVSTVTSLFARNESFTGRTDIWHAVRDVASRQPWLGVGYGSYWGLQDGLIYSTFGVREAHSGYLEVYLDVGIVGVIIFFAFLLSHYLKTLRLSDNAYDWGLFGICFLIMMLIENFTESHFFRTSSYFWNYMILMTVVFSSRDEHTNRADCAGD